MYYAKHKEHGNRHFDVVEDRAAMEAEGWKFFPHPEGNMPPYKEEPKRKPGRHRKEQLSGDSGA